MDADEFYKIIANYKFVIAMENAVCDDYVYISVFFCNKRIFPNSVRIPYIDWFMDF